jgi:hypothetical protein
VNMTQIAQARIGEDQLVLLMNDGNAITLHGKELVGQLLGLLCDHAVHPDASRCDSAGLPQTKLPRPDRKRMLRLEVR